MRTLTLAASLVFLATSGCGTPEPEPGPNTCAANFAGCTQLEDRTADDAERVVTFGDSLGNVFAPKCLKVKKGQAVTFNGNFEVHPTAQACGPAATIAHVTTGTTQAFTFETAGEFGYFCTAHGNPSGGGMAGRILVE